ncbi:unnamed protein product [marine sediment metagenome]|uniref:Uncharacterized protein n=1 Tax=marine sediment metagenome TaxID=412755 RepID=X0ZYX4_9ZZZZ
MKKMILILFVIFFLTTPVSVQAVDRIEAWVMAQDFVQSSLKAPSTAKFSGNPWRIQGGKCIDFKDGSYYIQAYVNVYWIFNGLER